MSASGCSLKYMVRGCQCLTDPMDPSNPICAYVSRDNGLVYPCDPGCCNPTCGTKVGHMPRMDVEFRQTFGGTLPPGFNVNLKTSDVPTTYDYEAPYTPVQTVDRTVGGIAFKLAVSLIVILLLVIYIGLKI